MMSGENGTVSPDIPYTEVAPWLRAVHSLVAISLMIACVLGNVLVLWIVATNKELHYRSIFASMGAVAVNIMFAVVTNTQVLAGSVTGEWPFGHRGCVAMGFLATSFFYVRWLNTCLIAVDRFLYIMAPFIYPRNSKRILITLTVLVWTLPFLTMTLSVIQGTYSYRSGLTFCAVECNGEGACTQIYSTIFGIYLIIGVVIPTVLYVFLYCFGKKKRRELQRELGTQAGDDTQPWTATEQLRNNRDQQPAIDMSTIMEEGEVSELDYPEPAELTSLELPTPQDLEAPRRHKILDTIHLQNGQTRIHLSTAAPEPPEENKTTLTEQTSEVPNQSVTKPQCVEEKKYNGVPGYLKRKGSNDSTQSPTHSQKRRPSLIAMSRVAFSAIVPGGQRVASQIRERQAMITFVIIFTALVITQLPLYILATSRRQDYYPQIPIWVHFIGVNLYLLAPALDPIIIMRSTDFKKALSKMFLSRLCRRRRRSSFSFSNSVKR